jgi:hypothetical protein
MLSGSQKERKFTAATTEGRRSMIRVHLNAENGNTRISE